VETAQQLALITSAVTLLQGLAGASGTVVAQPPAGRSTTAAVWSALEPGAERASIDDGAVRLELFRFDLERFDAEVVVAARARPIHARIWLAGPGHTADELLHDARKGGVVAAVNGGFFDENGRSLGLRLTHGDVAVPLRGKVDWGVFYVAGRRAHIVHSREFVPGPGIDAALQVGPRVLVDGAVPRLKPQVARRTAVALDREGRSLTLVIAARPIDATSLGNRLAALGFHSALLFDGGPSTQIATAVGAAGQLDIPGGYPVPDLLAIVRR
jgi:uncharacterized protein YigE (DUF2233 family)